MKRFYPVIIALSGTKGSGKTTAGKIILDKLRERNVNVSELVIAKNIKDSCSEIFGIPKEYFTDSELKERELYNPVFMTQLHISDMWNRFGVVPDYDFMVRPHIGKVFYTPRKLMQYVGTELLQSQDKTLLVKDALEKSKFSDVLVVTDLRFPHEIEELQKSSIQFCPLYIQRTLAQMNAAKDKHPSEVLMEEFKSSCTIVDNDGTIVELGKALDLILGNLGFV